MTTPRDGASMAPDAAFNYTSFLVDAVDDQVGDSGSFGGAGGAPMGSFMRLHLDATVLAAYESPSFDEATAVPLDALALSQSPPARPAKRAKRKAVKSSVKTEAKKSDSGGDDPSVGWMLSTLRAPAGDMRCRYRKGKCSNPRTLKKNGSLHTYCQLHRQRSVMNQRRFDTKKREARKCCCVGLAEAPCASESTQSKTTKAMTASQCASSGPRGGGTSDDATRVKRSIFPSRPPQDQAPQVIKDEAAWV